MLRYQDLMERFLETQRSLMSSYLQGYGGPEPELFSTSARFEEGNGHHPTPIAEPAIPPREARPPGPRREGPRPRPLPLPPRPRPRPCGTTATV